MGGRIGFGGSSGHITITDDKRTGSTRRKFEYDPAKSALNKEKHGIDFEEAKALWKDDRRVEISLKYPDEPRLMVVGIIDNKHYSAVFTMRGEAIRIISVRRSRQEEVEVYEQENNS